MRYSKSSKRERERKGVEVVVVHAVFVFFGMTNERLIVKCWFRDENTNTYARTYVDDQMKDKGNFMSLVRSCTKDGVWHEKSRQRAHHHL